MTIKTIGGITFITIGRWSISVARKVTEGEREAKAENARVSRKLERRLRRIGT